MTKAEAELVRLLVEGDARLDHYRRIGARVRLASIVLSAIALIVAIFPPNGIAIAAALLGLAGGACLGIFLLYAGSLSSWPLVRPLLDEQAVARFVTERKA
jgi:membrane associated rhomboid family serine protease